MMCHANNRSPRLRLGGSRSLTIPVELKVGAKASLVCWGVMPSGILQHPLFRLLASRRAVPSSYAWREFAASGGLISYGPSLTSAFRLVGHYVGKVLKGAKP